MVLLARTGGSISLRNNINPQNGTPGIVMRHNVNARGGNLQALIPDAVAAVLSEAAADVGKSGLSAIVGKAKSTFSKLGGGKRKKAKNDDDDDDERMFKRPARLGSTYLHSENYGTF
jgi:hypothetical protein